MKYLGLIFILLISCTSGRNLQQDYETLILDVPGTGQVLEVEIQQGSAYNHPSFVIWFEDLDGTYLETRTGEKQHKKFRLLMEMNQAWDSNRYWTHAKFPDDPDYFTSLQPAIVYAVTINPDEPQEDYYLNPIGHSHPSGKNEKLFTDISTLTTAKEIAGKIRVRIKQP